MEGSPIHNIEGYSLEKVIRRGSHGEIWLAKSNTGTWVAVKVVHRTFFESSKPFEREWLGLMHYEAISRKCPLLVSVLHVGRGAEDDCFYYVMDLADDADGKKIDDANLDYTPKTLAAEIQDREGMSPDRAAEIFQQILKGVSFLHENDLVHRDLKPSNILSIDGRYCLADPGFISRFDKTSSLIGTIGYIPPEGPGKKTGDIFSLGVLLYEMISGLNRNL